MLTHKIFNLGAVIIYDKDILFNLYRFESGNDMLKHSFARHAHQRFGFGVGVGTQTGTAPGYGKNNFHGQILLASRVYP
jgi:hypothetical protein